jgi:hypothetical protein
VIRGQLDHIGSWFDNLLIFLLNEVERSNGNPKKNLTISLWIPGSVSVLILDVDVLVVAEVDNE